MSTKPACRLCYDDIVASTVLLRCKSARVKCFNFSMFIEMWNFMLLCLRKKNSYYDHGFLYINKHRFVISRYCFLCETLFEHPSSGTSKREARRVEQ